MIDLSRTEERVSIVYRKLNKDSLKKCTQLKVTDTTWDMQEYRRA